ncbi:hypothetical protein [Frankia sp. Cppng1_Ct_nod]|uniref:hypothetical protein n=1 Tax=Frankia sp. Cppng1_Ct_nod TaxID=2897162 RepID=UPI001041A680|nr:hypothetical protein [Frankia sp. Cppng1_Ct_nod]
MTAVAEADAATARFLIRPDLFDRLVDRLVDRTVVKVEGDRDLAGLHLRWTVRDWWSRLRERPHPTS